MLLCGCLACCPGHAGNEDWREQRPALVVEEIAWRGYGFEKAVRERLVGVYLGGREEVGEGRKGRWERE